MIVSTGKDNDDTTVTMGEDTANICMNVFGPLLIFIAFTICCTRIPQLVSANINLVYYK